MKKIIKRYLEKKGYEISRIDNKTRILNTIEKEDKKNIEAVLKGDGTPYTMTSIERMVMTINSIKYIEKNNIEGDVIECGVWRGGMSILMAKTLERLKSKKKVIMFDTFNGMTEPTEKDIKSETGEEAKIKYEQTGSDWCKASIQDVKKNFEKMGVKDNQIEYIKGDVCKTIPEKIEMIGNIALLRLDTDWYESTKVEMQYLYPKITTRGVLLIDDYGHWEGARKAVDEYFEENKINNLLHINDYTGRSIVKI